MDRAPTEKQAAAMARNWGIRNLRALYALSYSLSPGRRVIVQGQIDDELEARGALRTGDHIVAQSRKAAERIRRAASLPDDIPF